MLWIYDNEAAKRKGLLVTKLATEDPGLARWCLRVFLVPFKRILATAETQKPGMDYWVARKT